jgi:hypothetical protein
LGVDSEFRERTRGLEVKYSLFKTPIFHDFSLYEDMKNGRYICI